MLLYTAAVYSFRPCWWRLAWFALPFINMSTVCFKFNFNFMETRLYLRTAVLLCSPHVSLMNCYQSLLCQTPTERIIFILFPILCVSSANEGWIKKCVRVRQHRESALHSVSPFTLCRQSACVLSCCLLSDALFNSSTSSLRAYRLRLLQPLLSFFWIPDKWSKLFFTKYRCVVSTRVCNWCPHICKRL